jgi:hypothetical protein
MIIKIFVLLFVLVQVNSIRNYTYESICKQKFQEVPWKDYFPFVHSFGVGFVDHYDDYMKLNFRVIKKLPMYWIPEHQRIPKFFGECRTKVIESGLLQVRKV